MSVNNILTTRYSPLDFTDPSIPHDRVLIVGEEKTKFYVYAGHLSFCSEYFRTMFTANFKEKGSDEIVLNELVAEDFNSFLKLLIPGNNAVIIAENYLSILTCARRFLAPDVISICEKFVVANFNSLDKIKMLKMAFDYDWEDLKEKIADELFPYPQKELNCSHGYGLGSYCQNCQEFVNYVGGPVSIQKTSYIVQNQEHFSALPAEIHSFILKRIITKID